LKNTNFLTGIGLQICLYFAANLPLQANTRMKNYVINVNIILQLGIFAAFKNERKIVTLLLSLLIMLGLN